MKQPREGVTGAQIYSWSVGGPGALRLGLAPEAGQGRALWDAALNL